VPTLQPGKCKYPRIARPPSEALGIDIGKTVGKSGYKLKVATSPSDTVDIFGLVLIV
jgi:predicted metal-binding protein